MPFTLPRSAKPIVDFGIHLAVGAIMALLLLGITFMLSIAVGLMERAGAPPWLVSGGHFLEFALFGFDAITFLLFVMAEAIKFIRSL
jgi:hypothetical protein